jgi:hypothetical protein
MPDPNDETPIMQRFDRLLRHLRERSPPKSEHQMPNIPQVLTKLKFPQILLKDLLRNGAVHPQTLTYRATRNYATARARNFGTGGTPVFYLGGTGVSLLDNRAPAPLLRSSPVLI